MEQEQTDVLVVGAGPAGMMAALCAAEQGARVTLLERNEKVGRKLYITGKGRCNLTNHCSAREVLENTPRNPRFLYSALEHTPPAWVEERFTACGVPLKVERGRRVFPCSDKAADIVDALYRALSRRAVRLVHDRARALLRAQGRAAGVRGEAGEYPAGAVVVACGGLSYPATGSTGDGYDFARAAGHTLLPAKPSLVPLESPEEDCALLQGLALKQVELRVRNRKGKLIFEEQGELLFTHFGLSGPLVLSASAHMRDFEHDAYRCEIDLKPALEEKKLDERLLREFQQAQNKQFQSVLATLLPRRMIPITARRCRVPLEKKVHDLTRQDRRALLEVLKCFPISISGPRPIEEAIVTSGGVKVSEVDPKTMQSKLCPGLFFAGEVLDVDAYTGGYNLQIAWATGRAAGEAAAGMMNYTRER